MCGQSLQIAFQKFEKSPWEHYISKKLYNFLINSYSFQVATSKFMKIHHVSKVLFICLKHSKQNVDKWFFCFKSLFSLSNVH
jgi:hypothetical protein